MPDSLSQPKGCRTVEMRRFKNRRSRTRRLPTLSNFAPGIARLDIGGQAELGYRGMAIALRSVFENCEFTEPRANVASRAAQHLGRDIPGQDGRFEERSAQRMTLPRKEQHLRLAPAHRQVFLNLGTALASLRGSLSVTPAARRRCAQLRNQRIQVSSPKLVRKRLPESQAIAAESGADEGWPGCLDTSGQCTPVPRRPGSHRSNYDERRVAAKLEETLHGCRRIAP